MSVRKIITYPHPILREKSLDVRNLNGPVMKVVGDLVETMYTAPHGIGISAPQIGEGLRIILVDVTLNPHYKRANHGKLLLINPKVVEAQGEKVTREGCMSIPDFVAFVRRPRIVVVRGWTPEGRDVKIEAKNLEAVALQHEIDHLNGVLFIDRITSLSELIPRNSLGKKK
jgi:peptide deformylase